jgi:hypothetical protein
MGSTYREIEVGAEDWIEVEFYGSPEMVNVGIGQYEYWGHVEYDNRYEAELEEAEWDTTMYTKDQNDAIRAYYDKNCEDICDSICQDFEPPERDEY